MNELIAGYANYASTEAILHEQQNAAVQQEVSLITFSNSFSLTISMSYTIVSI
ncbi:hypothetical protein [Sphaerimonospora thailandensis]|uniref:Uncharacterized protein n=1 Tax=Sphaerimonospora thailandensis TaxID=795644 RepID=A0A8J3W0Y0_9ACTN|nr:hypothetical protein [Sphaerimonospora thailandensis]GIH72107.1 hypothetical protein Mth01_43600 [Sphaerimonospora thailandensis]